MGILYKVSTRTRRDDRVDCYQKKNRTKAAEMV